MVKADLLPTDWKWVALQNLVEDPKSDIVDGPFGSNLKASEYVDVGIPIIRLQNIQRNLFLNKKIQYVTLEKSEQLRRHTFKSGDVVITKLGDPLGKACIIPPDLRYGVIVADVVRVRVNEQVVNKQFLVHAINSHTVIKQLAPLVKGSTRPRINLSHVRKISIPFAPLPEQERIVAKIEELFSQLDAGTAALRRVQAGLKRYRASVLKAAFEGRLVPQDPNDEPAYRMIEKKGKLIDEPLKYVALPDGWFLTSFENVVNSISNGLTKRQSKETSGIPVTRIETISDGTINVDKVGYVTELSRELVEKFRLNVGDILFSNINSDPHLGKTAIFNASDCFLLHGMNLLRIQLDLKCTSPKFIHYLFSHYRNSGLFSSIAQHAVNQSSINQSKLKNLKIPLPPMVEQNRIVEELEKDLSEVQKTEESIISCLQRSIRLRKSILKLAFEGKLI